ncbi:MAG: UPF0280 family protein [bacterium]|nr:UPF0280 family protein [bacterium]MDT8395684.1 UPF0280 family protein [bacterium]
MMLRAGFGNRDYREGPAPGGLVSFRAVVDETDLWIAARENLTAAALASIRKHRAGVEEYIGEHPGFASALKPWVVKVPHGSLVSRMTEAAAAVGIGPMAAVAGTIAEAVARDLNLRSGQVVVENGGDLYLIGGRPRRIGIWAGKSPLTNRVGLEVVPGGGIAVCTSSGTVGPSLSFGKADAAVVISRSGALADAAATALGNRVNGPGDVESALDWAMSVTGITGAVVVLGSTIGAKGQVELVPLADPKSKIQDPKSKIQDSKSRIQNPK